jgi:hypothetical protein
MSHHFDTKLATEDPSLNLCDFYLFDGPPGRTAMAMTVNPDVGLSAPDTPARICSVAALRSARCSTAPAMFTLVLTSPTCSGGLGLRVQIPRLAAIGRSPHSVTRTATAGSFRKSRRDFPAESAARRRPSRPPMIWRARFGAQRPHTANTRSAPGSATQSGQTGMPRTWWRRQAGRSCHSSDYERSLGRRVVGPIPAESGVGQADAV